MTVSRPHRRLTPCGVAGTKYRGWPLPGFFSYCGMRMTRAHDRSCHYWRDSASCSNCSSCLLTCVNLYLVRTGDQLLMEWRAKGTVGDLRRVFSLTVGWEWQEPMIEVVTIGGRVRPAATVVPASSLVSICISSAQETDSLWSGGQKVSWGTSAWVFLLLWDKNDENPW